MRIIIIFFYYIHLLCVYGDSSRHVHMWRSERTTVAVRSLLPQHLRIELWLLGLVASTLLALTSTMVSDVLVLTSFTST